MGAGTWTPHYRSNCCGPGPARRALTLYHLLLPTASMRGPGQSVGPGPGYQGCAFLLPLSHQPWAPAHWVSLLTLPGIWATGFTSLRPSFPSVMGTVRVPTSQHCVRIKSGMCAKCSACRMRSVDLVFLQGDEGLATGCWSWAPAPSLRRDLPGTVPLRLAPAHCAQQSGR